MVKGPGPVLPGVTEKGFSRSCDCNNLSEWRTPPSAVDRKSSLPCLFDEIAPAAASLRSSSAGCEISSVIVHQDGRKDQERESLKRPTNDPADAVIVKNC